MTWLPSLLLLALAPARAQSGEPPAPAPEASTATRAPSDADLEQAKLLYKNGATLYEEGLYDQAIQAFRESYELSKKPQLLFNIANAQERKGDLQAALDSLNTYRIYATPEQQETIDRRMRALERRIEEQKASGGTAPAPAPEADAPGFVLLSLDDEPVARTAGAGDPPPGGATAGQPNQAKWIVFASGAALTTGFGTTAAVTYASGRNFAEQGDREAYENVQTINNVSVTLAALGAGLSVIGLVMPAERPVSLTPTLNGAALGGRF